jgi:hypothetical protein
MWSHSKPFIGEESFEAAWKKGWAMQLQEAIEYALAGG